MIECKKCGGNGFYYISLNVTESERIICQCIQDSKIEDLSERVRVIENILGDFFTLKNNLENI